MPDQSRNGPKPCGGSKRLPRHTTRVGTGRFWVIDLECFNQREEFVGRESYDCFGYRRESP